MSGFVVIPDTMEEAMRRDLDLLRDSLPEDEREAFDAERDVHRQAIINHFAKHGTYPTFGGVERINKGAE